MIGNARRSINGTNITGIEMDGMLDAGTFAAVRTTHKNSVALHRLRMINVQSEDHRVEGVTDRCAQRADANVSIIDLWVVLQFLHDCHIEYLLRR
ncbi:hypothetical protein EVAR_80855_1 [Eumeta japonica]|uniref:Uncharacterized protein n=1 Tax=Eumeta variegata TaxID=151549 RepID=A0A4C1V0R6_EUMVA|nr:hypothetical protein EVAR_80855_1 [Eumeta japonica]